MQNESFYLYVPGGDTLICSRYIDYAAFEVAIIAVFKLKLYYFSKAVILVQFFMKFGAQGIGIFRCILLFIPLRII